MIELNLFTSLVFAFIFLRWFMQGTLEYLNQREVRRHAAQVPETFAGLVDDATYAKSVQYTLAKGRLSWFEITFDLILLILLLGSGLLPRAAEAFASGLGTSVWASSAFLFLAGVALSLLSLPVDWYAQFRLEERFGFNTTILPTWWMDRLKGLLLAALLGYPLLVLLLKFVEWTPQTWWWWGWLSLFVFQLAMIVIAPIWILPLFNKFTPLPEGSLRERLLALAERTRFPVQNILVMDGSKRSRHSNAFFTGFGRLRRVVLFDTLIQQLTEPELEAVLAHEIGHYKKRHIQKILLWSGVSSLAGFYLLFWLSGQEWFYQSFGFAPGNISSAFLLFGLLSGVMTFWLSPLSSIWSRRFEYQADAFAAALMKEAESLIGALRKLNEKNLSNLTPHPLYSFFYYSHPTLLERETALRK